MNYFVTGLRFLQNGYQIAHRDFEGAYTDENWNIAARRAFESLECTIKALHFLCGRTPAETHDVGLPPDINLVPLVAWTLEDDVRQSLAALVVKNVAGADRTISVFKMVHGTLTLLASSVPIAAFETLRLILDGSTWHVLSGDARLTSITDTSFGGRLQGQWVQLHLTKENVYQIKNAMKQVGKGRDAAFYLTRDFGPSDAAELGRTAKSVFGNVRGQVGHHNSI